MPRKERQYFKFNCQSLSWDCQMGANGCHAHCNTNAPFHWALHWSLVTKEWHLGPLKSMWVLPLTSLGQDFPPDVLPAPWAVLFLKVSFQECWAHFPPTEVNWRGKHLVLLKLETSPPPSSPVGFGDIGCYSQTMLGEGRGESGSDP